MRTFLAGCFSLLVITVGAGDASAHDNFGAIAYSPST
jgi:hypothetical protein